MRELEPHEAVLLMVLKHPVSNCWVWQGATNNGYASYFLPGPLPRKQVKAHRLMYESLIGDIPDGLDLDHLCRNRSCVNPNHLEPVTRGENSRRGARARFRKETCLRGHPFTEENTLRTTTGARRCRLCRQVSNRKSHLKNGRSRGSSVAR